MLTLYPSFSQDAVDPLPAGTVYETAMDENDVL